jgi:hypothetical protein
MWVHTFYKFSFYVIFIYGVSKKRFIINSFLSFQANEKKKSNNIWNQNPTLECVRCISMIFLLTLNSLICESCFQAILLTVAVEFLETEKPIK